MELLVYLISYLVTWNDYKSEEIVRIIFTEESKLKSDAVKNSVTTNKNTVNKKTELENALLYLKSKKNKTVKDRNSIGILEAVLQNYK